MTLTDQLNDLYATVHEDWVSFDAIDAVCARLATLDAAEVRQAATDFGLRLLASWGKRRVINEVRRKLTEAKGSAIRIKPITQPVAVLSR